MNNRGLDRVQQLLVALVVAILATEFLGSAGCGGAAPRPTLVVDPDTLLIGDELQIRLKGIRSRTTATVHAQRLLYVYPHGETPHYSYATFGSGAAEINLGTDAPQAGTYEGADVRALLWSMQPVLNTEEATRLRAEHPGITAQEALDASTVVFDLEVDGRVVATERLVLTTRAPGLLVNQVDHGGLHGVWAHPRSEHPLPGIMILGGSEGGVRATAGFAEVLASHGYSVLALAYFGDRELPPALTEVPIEYMERGLSWLSAQPETDSNHLAVVGMSKGAEAALLLASHRTDLDAVVGYAPSSVAWQSPVDANKSSWTIVGRPVPFVSTADLSEGEFKRAAAADSAKQERSRPASYYIAQVAPEQYRRAAIAVERSSASFLLISGGRDRVWHSLEMGEAIVTRLHESGFDHGIEHLKFPEAGHGIAGQGMRPSAGDPAVLGGTPGADARAQYEGWQRVLRFLEEHLRVTRDR